MGNTVTCFEGAGWVAHSEIDKAYTPTQTDVYQDMQQPLSHYFISSGHNSYLTGDQLFASAGTTTIVKSLRGGCRVVELDVYNGPVCKHGGTLTKPISFEKCIEAIGSAAFTSSPYPVIITMENHTDVQNQALVAKILRAVLGERLFVPNPNDPRDKYLSPAKLLNKIVCRTSVKKSGVYDPDFLSLIYIRNTKCTSLKDMIERVDVVSSSFEESAMPQSDDLGGEDPEHKAAKSQEKVMKRSMSSKRRLKNGCWRRQVQPPAGEAPEDALLAGEERMVAGSLHELYTYSCRHLVRVYPGMWRWDSSNYNPMRAWVRGASLAALNWQVWDKALWCNEAMFMDNGRCGYVLKPEWMRSPERQLPARPARRLVVHVYSAHLYQGSNCCIFKDDPFVKLNVWGMPCDSRSQKTRPAHDTGRLTVDKEFSFDVRYPEVAMLCIALKDDDAGGLGGPVGRAVADTLGYFTLPLSTLREGKYKLMLRDPRNGASMVYKDAWVKVGLHWRDAPEEDQRQAEGAEEREDHRQPEARQGAQEEEDQRQAEVAPEKTAQGQAKEGANGTMNPMFAGPEASSG